MNPFFFFLQLQHGSCIQCVIGCNLQTFLALLCQFDSLVGCLCNSLVWTSLVLATIHMAVLPLNAAVDSSVRHFIRLEEWATGRPRTEPSRHKALLHSFDAEVVTGLNVNVLFRATRCRCHQLAFREAMVSHASQFDTPSMLCTKRGCWIPISEYPQHLPIFAYPTTATSPFHYSCQNL